MVQSSIKVTNQHDPFKVGTLDGPQTLECITIKESELLFELNRNEYDDSLLVHKHHSED